MKTNKTVAQVIREAAIEDRLPSLPSPYCLVIGGYESYQDWEASGGLRSVDYRTFALFVAEALEWA